MTINWNIVFNNKIRPTIVAKDLRFRLIFQMLSCIHLLLWLIFPVTIVGSMEQVQLRRAVLGHLDLNSLVDRLLSMIRTARLFESRHHFYAVACISWREVWYIRCCSEDIVATASRFDMVAIRIFIFLQLYLHGNLGLLLLVYIIPQLSGSKFSSSMQCNASGCFPQILL